MAKREDFSQGLNSTPSSDSNLPDASAVQNHVQVDDGSLEIHAQNVDAVNERRESGFGTFLPVSDPPIYGHYQGQSCHWMQVRPLYAQELPLRMPRRIGRS
jgi:hypothetical protein